MVIDFQNKKINVPDDELENLCKSLDINEDEALEVWLTDNEYLENEEAEELTKKAKANKTDKIVVTDKTKERKKATREPKTNPLKQEIIQKIAEMLANQGIQDLKVTNPTKIIEFSIENRDFKLDLVEKRKK